MLDNALPHFAEVLPLQQSPAYARTLRGLGQGTELLRRDGVGQMTTVSRLTPFGILNAAMRGPLWDSDDPKAQIAFLRENPVQVLSPEHTATNVLRRAGYWRAMTPAHVGILNLVQDHSSQMRQKWRNSWRKGLRSGLRVEAKGFDAARDDWILILDRAQQRAAGFRGYPRAFTQTFAQNNRDAAVTYVAYLGAIRVAAMVFLLHAPTATYHIGWSGEDGRRTNAHHVLLARAAADFAARGITALDLGFIDTRRAPGLARFKLGAGAQPTALGGTWLRLPWRR